MPVRFLDEEQPAPVKGKVRFLDELAPTKIPAYGGMEGVRRLAYGPIGYGTAPGAEDVLPAAGQIAGSSVGGFGGSVAGATAGQAARQGIRSFRGKGFDWSSLPKEAAMTAMFEGGGRALSKAAEPLANRLMNSVIKPGREILKRNPKFGLDALEAGITGSRGQMVDKAERLLTEGESELSKILKSKAGNVDVPKIASGLDDIKRPFSNVGDQGSVDAVDELQKYLTTKGNIGLEDANQLKRDLYKVVKDSQYGKGVGEIASKQTARKQAARGLKKGIEAVAPEVMPINKKIGTAVQAKEALENAIANSQKSVILPKLAGMGAGSLAMTGNIPAAVGVLAGDAATHYIRSAPFVTGLAKNLMRGRTLMSPIAKIGAEGARRLFYKN